MSPRRRDPRVTLIVFARRPRAGHCKRRLARAVGARRAARLYAATLAATLMSAERVAGVRRVLLAASPAEARWFARWLHGRDWRIGSQARGDLGARMAVALERALASGAPAFLLGADVVDVTAAELAAARDALVGGREVVLGPAHDGGYWLIGLARPQPGLFTDMPWGTPQVAARTRMRARREGFELAEIARCHDLDRGRDLLNHRARLARATRGLPGRAQRRRARARSSSAT
ncbi:MAG: TIGR04282 family arsenosugar biosynthesis glycosyltransferase [Gammaproteobacteria bacterium]